MSSTPATLNRQAIDLLIEVLEAPIAKISAAALQGLPQEVCAQLKATGLIKPDGHEPVATSMADQEDRPVPLTWSPDHGAFGYFSPSAGWVSVRHSDIETYRVDLAAFVTALTAKLRFSPRKMLSALVADLLWDTGTAQIGSRRLTPLMFGRRLHDVATWSSVERILEARGLHERRLILTTTRLDRLPKAPSQQVFTFVADMLGESEGLAIAPAALVARFDGLPSVEQGEPIRLIADGREVHFFGKKFRFTGLRQREIIGLIYKRYKQGQRWTSSAEILEALEFPERARIRDYFTQNPAWNELITERNGMCGFCLDDHTDD